MSASAFQGLTELLARAGCAAVELPILQPAGIFLEVSGEELRRRLFLTSDPGGSELCLRPDMTIPTARLHMDTGPAGRTARYAYLGPVFRHRQTGASEFLQAGAESFGFADGPAEEAAMLALAFAAAAELGLARPTVRIGDVGLLDALVSALDLPPAWRRILHRDLTRERPLGAAALVPPAVPDDAEPGRLGALMRLPPADARQIVREMLAMSGVGEVAGRSLEEIAERFLEQAEFAGDTRPTAEVRAIVDRYMRIAGSPSDVIAELRRLQRETGLDIGEAIDRFDARALCFRDLGMDEAAMSVATAFGRNLDYYSGLVFELSDPENEHLGPLVAGGRYDGLFAALGADAPVPAVGFSIWLDRFARIEP
jgi:ATP phosphoribosyltransferase regulatory subunit